MITPRTTYELDERISCPSDDVIQTVRDSPGRFAVLGAGGKMGFHVSRMLQRALESLGRREQVVTVSRFGSTEKRQLFAGYSFDVHAADMSDPDQVRRLPDVENVFYLAGIKFGTADNPALLEQMNITMPRLVAARYQGSRIVALSTGCVYEYVAPSSGGSTETSATDPPGAYAQSCLGREHAFVENAVRHQTPTSLIRLNYANELRYGVLVDIGQKVLAGEEVSLEMGYVNLIWQGDAVSHIIQSLKYAASPPFILNVTGEQVLAVRDLALKFGERLGKSPKFVGTPSETAWLNNASLSHQLMGQPQISVDRMIDWIADWLQAGGETLNKPTHFDVRSGDY